MKEYKRIELNEKEYLMVTEETNVFEVVIDTFLDALILAIKLAVKAVQNKNK